MLLLDREELDEQHEQEGKMEEEYMPFMSDRIRIYVPYGWMSIVWDMLDRIAEVGPGDYEIVQIKEKFAELRVYFNKPVEDDVIEEIVDEAKKEAKNTCQVCGKQPSQRVSDGWAYQLCTSHKQEMKQKNS